MILESPVVDIRPVDFDCVDKAIEAATQILINANDSRLFLTETSRQSINARQIIRAAGYWVDSVRDRNDAYSPGDALKLTDLYDLLHRLAFRQPADRQFLNRIILRAFDAMKHGDAGVDEYMLFRAIRNAVRLREKDFFGIHLKWTCISLDRWHKEAAEGFDSTELSDYDILSRVNILLDSDLYAYEGSDQHQFKQRLAEQHRRYLDAPASSSDPRMASALDNFRLLCASVFS